jgi:hypothetical protein
MSVSNQTGFAAIGRGVFSNLYIRELELSDHLLDIASVASVSFFCSSEVTIFELTS